MSAPIPYKRASWSWEQFDGSVAASWFDSPNLIPFLGPECGRLGLDSSSAAAIILGRVDAIAGELPLEAANYLDEVVKQRLPATQEVAGAPTSDDDQYFAFLIQVVQLGMSATRLFTSVISEKGSAVIDWRQHLQESDLVKGTPADLRQGFFGSQQVPEFYMALSAYLDGLSKAIAMATELQQRANRAKQEHERSANKADKRALGDTFDEHLWQLFGAEGVVAALKSIEHSTIDHDKSANVTRIALRGEQVEWLTNLVWHTLRFDVSLYPSADELAFQLSMTCWPKGKGDPSGLATITKPELSLATQNAKNPDSVATQLGWAIESATVSERRTRDRSEFYETIAMIMLDHACRFRQNPDHKKGTHKYRPVVFSSSFDWELELELLVRASGPREALSVFVPVMLVSEDSATASLQWVYASIEPQDDEAKARQALADPVWQWVPVPEPGDNVVREWPVKEGISVVKVNGSPLHYSLDGSRIADHAQLRDGLDDPDMGILTTQGIGRESELRHALVLSEFEHLRAVSLEIRKLSPNFFEALRVDSKYSRRLILIGHPITDWITRIRVLSRFADIADTQWTDDLVSYLVGPEMDLMRASLLGWADIKPVAVETMNQLVDALKSYSDAYRHRVGRS